MHFILKRLKEFIAPNKRRLYFIIDSHIIHLRESEKLADFHYTHSVKKKLNE